MVLSFPLQQLQRIVAHDEKRHECCQGRDKGPPRHQGPSNISPQELRDLPQGQGSMLHVHLLRALIVRSCFFMSLATGKKTVLSKEDKKYTRYQNQVARVSTGDSLDRFTSTIQAGSSPKSVETPNAPALSRASRHEHMLPPQAFLQVPFLLFLWSPQINAIPVDTQSNTADIH